MERDAVVEEFTHQSAAFNASSAMRSEETLGRLIDLLPASPGERWLEAACGPGLVARALAPRVEEVRGVDLTPAMIALARLEAQRDGIANIAFATGDVTGLEFEDRTFDGAVTRFSLHHIPFPGRVLRELARVVKQGGWVVVADHLTAEDMQAAAWHQEIERLRDPTHWACLSAAQLRNLGEKSGLRLAREERWAVALDYEEWLERASTGAQNRALIDGALAGCSEAPSVFHLARDATGTDRLNLVYGVFIWQRP